MESVETSSREILVVDDEAGMRETLELLLQGEGYRVTLAADGQEAIDQIDRHDFALVLTDLKMPRVSGAQVLDHVKKISPATQVILLTAFGTDQRALSAMAEGAFDYVEKPFNIENLRFQIRRALTVHDLAASSLGLHPGRLARRHLGSIIGRSPTIRAVYDIIHKVAKTPTNTLLTGESGTGKELAARTLHELSGRSEGPFVVINCGAIPENLLESELFGHRKGAFTGAVSNKPGRISMANGGTLLLDEVGELPSHMQVKLLRVIQERTFVPVGAVDEESVDVRIIAATNQNLEAIVGNNTFREDLYYRLNVVQIEMPPLRHRRGDIPILAGTFLRQSSRETGKDIRAMAPETLDILMRYSFPGNVRELENIIERSVTFETSNILSADYFAPHVLRGETLGEGPVSDSLELPGEGMDLEENLASIERKLLCDALERTSGNQTEAANLLGISFRSIRYKVHKYGIDLNEFARNSRNNANPEEF